jgi:hypothetical protein
MSTIKPLEGSRKAQKKWRVKGFAIIYLTALFTFTAPISATTSPTLDPVKVKKLTDPRTIARNIAQVDYSWGNKQFTCLSRLWGKESAWNPKAVSPTNDHGIPQRNMPNHTQSQKNAFLNDTRGQIIWGLNYISIRYNNPCNAWQFWQKNRWY